MKKILWITQTAVMIALLIVFQATTAPLGNQFVTGSLVNMMLFVSTMLFGLYSGLAVAVLSPFFAFMFGIGPAFPVIIPFIALGNGALVLVYHLVASKRARMPFQIAGVAAASVAKFGVLYVGIVLIVAPRILALPPAAPIYWMFSIPQLITAAIGGAVALVIVPMIRLATKKKN
ncbi:MAG: hypothetical protein FWC69_06335 [Defluviitaleaceae bacterium]|nr:hypothetical protein [Defluviitaleaceae bacterium]